MVKKWSMPLTGALVAVAAIVLTAFGNPANMGFCIACFLRDTAGALGLHSAAAVQYARPEIPGIVLGAFLVSLFTKEFSPKGGSAPVTRFVLGACVMVGALIFLGCPLRMVLRIAGGDMNAVVGLFGFGGGILGGIFFLNKGFTLQRTYKVTKSEGFVLPVLAIVLLVVLIVFPGILLFSESGPGSMTAPVWIALGIGLVIGAIGFITRLCFVAGIRDSVLFKNFSMLSAFVAIIVVGIVLNLIMGNFNLGFENQPIAHTDGVWNFLGMTLVGFGSVLLGGCPFRQLVLAGSGNSDSVMTVFGMIAGAALSHNMKMASSAAGVTDNGKVGFVVALVIVLCVAVYNTFFSKKAGEPA